MAKSVKKEVKDDSERPSRVVKSTDVVFRDFVIASKEHYPSFENWWSVRARPARPFLTDGQYVTPGEAGSSEATFTRGAVWDVASLLSEAAKSEGNESASSQFGNVAVDAAQGLSKDELLDRYSDYQDSLFGLQLASTLFETAVRETDIGLGKDGDPTWIERAKGLLSSVKTHVTNALRRLLGFVAERFRGFPDFASSVAELVNSFGHAVKEKIVNGFHRIGQAMAAVAAGIISKFLAWMAGVREIAKQHGFTLKSLKITLDPVSFGIASVGGIPVPIPKVSIPKVELEFA